jgi:hypothetical protein
MTSDDLIRHLRYLGRLRRWTGTELRLNGLVNERERAHTTCVAGDQEALVN